MDRKLKHLDFIQAVINRLSTNSFLLKGWSVVLISALFALSANDANIKFILLAYFPAIAFWALDGYFLALERGYRELYEKVRIIHTNDIDFSMDTREVQNSFTDWAGATVSKTLIVFHGALIGSILIVMLIQM
ncbi:hypothetical protein ACT7LO_001690 [Providencia rettgeri]